MNQRSLVEVLGLMIAGGGIEWLPARTNWPMHVALKELDQDTGRRGLRSSLGASFVFDPSSEAGWAARGADAALIELVHAGLLVPEGTKMEAGLTVDVAKVVSHRRALMGVDVRTAALLQRAGSRWAALASTIAKKPEASRFSPDSIVASRAV
jgi:hypothetical protein